MPELASHVLAAFVLFTVIGWRIEWVDRNWVIVGMVGVLLPDLDNVGMILDGDAIEAVLGIPWGWGAISSLGGLLVLAALGAVLFEGTRSRLRAFVLLVAGGALHLLMDGMVAWADGRNGMLLYPFMAWRNPTPGVYVSSDRWISIVCLALAVLVFVLDRWVRNTPPAPDAHSSS